MKKRVGKKELLRHETKKSAFIRFLIVVGIFIVYLIFMSFRHGLGDGIMISLLTWSFFVLCTPIADAEFLLDFPVRIFIGIRMIYSEIGVWIIAGLINFYSFFFNNSIYSNTGLLTLFRVILSKPIPYWLIILLSATGTYLSVYFGDELMDVVKHKQRKKYNQHKKKYLIIIGLFVLVAIIIILYHLLLKNLGISI